MKNILLVCSAGMSTSLLVNKMIAAAKDMGIEINIKAMSISECASAVDQADIVLLGPQIRYQKSQVDALVKGRVPVEIIDMRLYGMMNGKAVLEQALKSIEK